MFVSGSYRTNKSAPGNLWTSWGPCLSFLRPKLCFLFTECQAYTSGHARSRDGWRQQPRWWVASAAPTLGPWLRWPGVCGFWSSHNGRTPREMLVSEHMLVSVSYQLHLGCSSPNTSVQPCTATLCAIDFKGSRVTNFSRSWEVVIVLLLSYNIFIQDMLVAVEIQFRGDWFTRLHQWCMQQSVHRLLKMDAWGVLL